MNIDNPRAPLRLAAAAPPFVSSSRRALAVLLQPLKGEKRHVFTFGSALAIGFNEPIRLRFFDIGRTFHQNKRGDYFSFLLITIPITYRRPCSHHDEAHKRRRSSIFHLSSCSLRVQEHILAGSTHRKKKVWNSLKFAYRERRPLF